ncbi:hypothetical protein MY3296_008036 [Beauveria thailandica]
MCIKDYKGLSIRNIRVKGEPLEKKAIRI